MTDLADLLRGRTVLLVDFDGPICSVFAGYPAPTVASELRGVAAAHGIEVPPALADTDDPLVFLREIADVATTTQTRAVADALRDREVIAVETATETPGAADVLQAAKATGRRVAIVSNNSAEAVKVYLRRNGLHNHVAFISARYDGISPLSLKPDPYLLKQALAALREPPYGAAIIGDSVSDVEAARAVGIFVIGCASRRSKRQALTDAGAGTVVNEPTDRIQGDRPVWAFAGLKVPSLLAPLLDLLA